MDSRPSTSLEYVQTEVQCEMPSGTQVNLTGYNVDIGIVARGEPAGGDWKVASWVPLNESGGKNIARLLVGPGGDLVLTEGVYWVFTRVHTPPELPVLKSQEQLAIT